MTVNSATHGGHVSRSCHFNNAGKGHKQPGRYSDPNQNLNALQQSSKVGREVLSNQDERCERARTRLQEKLRKQQQQHLNPVAAIAALNLVAQVLQVDRN